MATSDLERFVEAQDGGGTYDRAIAELRAGSKRSHWMGFVFPQLAGLGRSPIAKLYELKGLEEARAYVGHPVLGPRLVEATETLCALETRDAQAVLGDVDAMKLRSSMTLFARAAPEQPAFRTVLGEWFDGEDEATLARL